LVGSISTAYGNADSWKTAANGFWAVGTNWVDGSTPVTSDTANFNVFGSYTVTFNATPSDIQALSVLQGTAILNSSGGAKTLNVTAATGQKDLVAAGANTGLFIGSSGNPMNLTIGHDLAVQTGATVGVQSGSHVSAGEFGLGGLVGTLRIDGSGTTFALSTAGTINSVGLNGGSGTLIFQNSGVGTIAGDLEVANSGVASGTLSVLSGGNLALGGSLKLANNNAIQNAIANVNGANSAITQSGNGIILVGAATFAPPR
jgi:hypothetical protein